MLAFTRSPHPEQKRSLGRSFVAQTLHCWLLATARTLSGVKIEKSDRPSLLSSYNLRRPSMLGKRQFLNTDHAAPEPVGNYFTA